MNDRLTGWRKSSFTGGSGNCVEVAAGWRKSSYSDVNGSCVEVADRHRSSRSHASGDCAEVSSAERVIGVRDTKQHGHGPVIELPVAAWRAFLTQAKGGQLDC